MNPDNSVLLGNLHVLAEALTQARHQGAGVIEAAAGALASVRRQPHLLLVHAAAGAARAATLAELARERFTVREILAPASPDAACLAHLALAAAPAEFVLGCAADSDVALLAAALAHRLGVPLLLDGVSAPDITGVAARIADLPATECPAGVLPVRAALAAPAAEQRAWARRHWRAAESLAGSTVLVLVAGEDAEAHAAPGVVARAVDSAVGGEMLLAADALVLGPAAAALHGLALAALAAGLPVLARDPAPHAALLGAALVRALPECPDWPAIAGAASEGIGLALGEFGLAVNAARLGLALDLASGRAEASRLALAAWLAERFPAASLPPAGDDGIDLVMFWKQNDSGIYDRRADMLLRQLCRSGRVRQVLQFDAPMAEDDLAHGLNEARSGQGSEMALVARNTLARWLGQADGVIAGVPVRRRSLVWSEQAGAGLLGHGLGEAGGFADFVAAEMRAAGISPARCLAWVWPVVRDFPEIDDLLGFSTVVADLVDDQRDWKASPLHVAQLDASYAQTLRRADLVLSNCATLAARFADKTSGGILVVPNGANLDAFAAPAARPAALEGWPGPVIGYVGDLRQRIDWDALRDLAGAHAEWCIALVGALDASVPADLLGRANVLAPGVLPAEQAAVWIAHFDVALVPHLAGAMTAAMHPLKVYQYLAAGRRVVARGVANLEELEGLIEIVPAEADFTAAVEAALLATPPEPDALAAALQRCSWEARVAMVLDALDRPGGEAAAAQDVTGPAAPGSADSAAEAAMPAWG